MRADRQRSRESILAAARDLVEKDGAQVSLEAVARHAGVGSATLHRHFPSRQALLEVVFRDSIAQLCHSAASQPGNAPGKELVLWLEELTERSTSIRGLTTALLAGPEALPPNEICCRERLQDAAGNLVSRAKSDGWLRPDATIEDLLTLTTAISSVTEDNPAMARRLLHLALEGVGARQSG